MPQNKKGDKPDTEQAPSNKPPYITYKTFWGFIESLKTHGIPKHIDRSIMGTMSGSNQSLTIHALSFLGLIDDKRATTPLLNSLVYAEAGDRKQILQDIVKRSYPDLFEHDFIKHATQHQFRQKFTIHYPSGSTLVKSQTFFVRIAKDAGIEISAYIKPNQGLGRKNRTPKPPSSYNAGEGTRDNTANGDVDQPFIPPMDKKKSWNELLLDKFPQFDANWSEETKQKWFDSFRELQKLQTDDDD